MNVLAVTNLFPNCAEPGRGVFNRQQFAELKGFCGLKVIAPLPWAPGFLGAAHGKVPLQETIDGIDVYHPRYLVTPKIGRRFYGQWYYQAIRPFALRLRAEFRFDLIFATWGYPDCYGASLVARELSVPLVCRVHGTDINAGAENPARRSLMKKAFDQAYRVVVNSAGLRAGVESIGVAPEKISVIINGVDTKRFFPRDKAACRRELQLDGAKKHVLFIGNLVDIKGVHHLIEAAGNMPENVILHVIGSGPLEARLKSQAQAQAVRGRIFFHGRKPHEEIPRWLNAADVLCLPSANEGCPNVVLEALACRTPVAASKVGAIPDVVDSADKGRLFPPGDAKAIAKSIAEIFKQSEQGLTPHFEAISWRENAVRLFEIFKAAVHS